MDPTVPKNPTRFQTAFLTRERLDRFILILVRNTAKRNLKERGLIPIIA